MSEQWEYFHEVQSVHSELFPNVKAWESHFESVRDKTTGKIVVRIRDKRHAMLIAAAPDMLDALIELGIIVKIHSEATKNNFAWAEMQCAREAIAKATGRPIDRVLK